jgi:hypothetical protein
MTESAGSVSVESVKMGSVGEAVRLTVVPDEGAAEALCGFLRTEGIDCFYRETDSAAGVFGGMTFAGWREILVAEDDLERARELLSGQPL